MPDQGQNMDIWQGFVAMQMIGASAASNLERRAFREGVR